MEETRKCPKCGGDMVKGKINTPAPAKWTPSGNVPLLSGKDYFTYACSKCGFTESWVEIK